MKFLKDAIIIAAIFAVFCVYSQAQETGGAKGKIKNAQEKGIAGVTVTAEQAGKTVKSISTDKNGAFTLDGLKSGKYNFIFSKNGFTTGTLNSVEVGNKKIRDLGNRLLEVDEGTLVLIKGSVFNQEGRSLYGAKVEIERISGGSQTKNPKPYYTSEDGDFTFRFSEGLAKFRVTASAKGKSASKEIEVDSAAIYRLALTLNLSEVKDN